VSGEDARDNEEFAGKGWLLSRVTTNRTLNSFVYAELLEIGGSRHINFPRRCSCAASVYYGLPCPCILFVLSHARLIMPSNVCRSEADAWRSDPALYFARFVNTALRTRTTSALQNARLELELLKTAAALDSCALTTPAEVATLSDVAASGADAAGVRPSHLGATPTLSQGYLALERKFLALLAEARAQPDLVAKLDAAVDPLYSAASLSIARQTHRQTSHTPTTAAILTPPPQLPPRHSVQSSVSVALSTSLAPSTPSSTPPARSTPPLLPQINTSFSLAASSLSTRQVLLLSSPISSSLTPSAPADSSLLELSQETVPAHSTSLAASSVRSTPSSLPPITSSISTALSISTRPNRIIASQAETLLSTPPLGSQDPICTPSSPLIFSNPPRPPSKKRQNSSPSKSVKASRVSTSQESARTAVSQSQKRKH